MSETKKPLSDREWLAQQIQTVPTTLEEVAAADAVKAVTSELETRLRLELNDELVAMVKRGAGPVELERVVRGALSNAVSCETRAA